MSKGLFLMLRDILEVLENESGHWASLAKTEGFRVVFDDICTCELTLQVTAIVRMNQSEYARICQGLL